MKGKKVLKWVGGILVALVLIVVVVTVVVAIVAPDALFLPYGLYLNTRTTTTFEVHGDELWMDGYINHKTYNQFVEILEANPQITTLVEGVMHGSLDDDTMIKLAYYVRENGLNTHLRSTSQIDSGAVDLFLAGMERTMERGAHIGVHSWSDGMQQAKDIPPDDPQHRKNAQYIKDMLGSEDFYWFTIYASPANGIHEMTEDEILEYGMLTQPIMEPSTDEMPGVLANKIETDGNADSDVVIVYSQHGPMMDLLGWGGFVYFPKVDRDKVYLVDVHQAQTYAPYNFSDEPITAEDAQAAADISVQYLADIVQFYLDEGRTVYVVGKGYGAYLVQELLATQGNVAEGYLLAAGRLDMQDAAVQQLASGQSVKFENGTTPVPGESDAYASEDEGAYANENLSRLLGAVAVNRYTERLTDTPMDNVVYTYGEQDERLGGLTADEVSFLKGKGVQVLAGADYAEAAKDLMTQGLEMLLGEAYMK